MSTDDNNRLLGYDTVDDGYNKDGCCTKCLKCIPPIYWYLESITVNLCHSLGCFIFSFYNFCISTWIIFALTITLVAAGIPLIIVFCIGIIFIWLFGEITTFFCYLDLWISYYLTENNKNNINKNKLKLRIYENMPKCGKGRLKSFYYNDGTYLMIIYGIFFKPLIAGLTWWPSVIVLYFGAFCFTPVVYYASDETQALFNDSKICFLNGSIDNGDGNHECWRNYGMIDSGTKAFMVMGVSLLILPIALKLNNLFAKWAKNANYFFYTIYYSPSKYNYQDMKAIEPMYEV